jgi:nucleoside-diphosphate kinase
MRVTKELAEQHYQEHSGKPFFGGLIDFITSGPVFVMIWQGGNIVNTARNMIGKTNPAEADSGTIRGDYASILDNNVIHGSDSVDSAEREIAHYFSRILVNMG